MAETRRPEQSSNNMWRKKQTDRHWREWYSLKVWRTRAKYQLQIQPLCCFCKSRGMVTMATVADHVVPHNGEWNAFRLGALQSLCRSCHSKTKDHMQRHGWSAECDEAGRPVDPKHPAYAAQGDTLNDVAMRMHDERLND
jgi:5-methylcytosine-specific restriction enzyme A